MKKFFENAVIIYLVIGFFIFRPYFQKESEKNDGSIASYMLSFIVPIVKTFCWPYFGYCANYQAPKVTKEKNKDLVTICDWLFIEMAANNSLDEAATRKIQGDITSIKVRISRFPESKRKEIKEDLHCLKKILCKLGGIEALSLFKNEQFTPESDNEFLTLKNQIRNPEIGFAVTTSVERYNAIFSTQMKLRNSDEADPSLSKTEQGEIQIMKTLLSPQNKDNYFLYVESDCKLRNIQGEKLVESLFSNK